MAEAEDARHRSAAPRRPRIGGSIASHLFAVAHGASIVRVHDVAETRQAIAVWEAAQAGSETGLV